MSPTLARWNDLSNEEAIAALLPCCASIRWAAALAAQRPFASTEHFFRASDTVWRSLGTDDYLEAFRAHPRIGESKAPHATATSLAWSQQEQSLTTIADTTTLAALAAGNRAYESRHGFTYIVCATGKSAEEMLAILNRRIDHSTAEEILEAAEQQRHITNIRLKKWLSS